MAIRKNTPRSHETSPKLTFAEDLSCTPSGLPWNQTVHSKSQRVVDKKFSPGLQTYMRVSAEFLLTRKCRRNFRRK